MGSGKSTIGKIVAKKLNLSFYDLDQVFECRYKIEIKEFFNKYGEAAFRKIEHEILKEFAIKTNCIISTGGGTPCFYNNAEFMNQQGKSIFISLSAETLFSRLKNSSKKRPLLTFSNKTETIQGITYLLSEREKHYKKATFSITVDNQSIETVVAKVIELIQTRKVFELPNHEV